MYTYVGLGARAADRSDLDQVLSCPGDNSEMRSTFQARCLREVPQLARLSSSCWGLRRSCLLRVVLVYANITLLKLTLPEVSSVEP